MFGGGRGIRKERSDGIASLVRASRVAMPSFVENKKRRAGRMPVSSLKVGGVCASLIELLIEF